MYRDTIRGVCLCALGDGHLLVQALAGNVRAGGDAARFDEVLELFERREDFNFSWMLVCSEDVTLLELARAAQAIDRNSDARDFLTRSLRVGSPVQRWRLKRRYQLPSIGR